MMRILSMKSFEENKEEEPKKVFYTKKNMPKPGDFCIMKFKNRDNHWYPYKIDVPYCFYIIGKATAPNYFYCYCFELNITRSLHEEYFLETGYSYAAEKL